MRIGQQLDCSRAQCAAEPCQAPVGTVFGFVESGGPTLQTNRLPTLCLPADAINIMLHVQHRPGAQPGAPRHGFQAAEGTAPSYSGAGGREPEARSPLALSGAGAVDARGWGETLPSAGGRLATLPVPCPAGAVWDLVRREDRPQLRQFFQDYLDGQSRRQLCCIAHAPALPVQQWAVLATLPARQACPCSCHIARQHQLCVAAMQAVGIHVFSTVRAPTFKRSILAMFDPCDASAAPMFAMSP